MQGPHAGCLVCRRLTVHLLSIPGGNQSDAQGLKRQERKREKSRKYRVNTGTYS